MKWTTAVRHVEELAVKCEELAGGPKSFTPLRVVQLWAAGDLLGAPRDLDRVTVAVVVDLPVEDVPWLSEPHGAEHWANATRVSRNPIRALWRSAHAPVWNHHVDRPALVWDAADGVAGEALAALAEGRGEQVRLPAPGEDEFRARLRAELAVALRALRHHTRAYEEKRWAPGKLTAVSDALWRAGEGYLDLLDAVDRDRPASPLR
ncbi:hypothetical protein IOD16_13575 [Saccharothrix sp. 6-C]|uniref:DUF7711 family protein n=1 Tax=Saccharothrix sp. 6-C TaxID=2781735 RepID=UPI001916E404|nr:hypothetical protein [Saccharothrix sp. 6-C]QQQ79353.1 hypothetical protein IOD16_13575 [Saccharothrix sp. 6-C]